jgi:hypothetical protein
MSSTGIKIVCSMPEVVNDQFQGPQYSVYYEFYPVPGDGHVNGSVRVNLGDMTPSEFSAQIQQLVVDHANADYTGNDFIISDVLGGLL